ncbi:hypothetical protein HK096_004722, partial [Nowakowskiella sp. JEL0078]
LNYFEDILDDFSAPQPQRPQAPPPLAPSEPQLDADFLSLLSSNMSALFPAANNGDDDKEGQTQILEAGLEQLMSAMQELQFKEKDSGLKEIPSEYTGANVELNDFQSKIESTMNKLRDSSEKVEEQLESEANNFNDATLQQMISEFEALMGSGGGDFEELIKGVVDNLYTKEMLKEPLLDLGAKYPEWLSNNKSTLSEEEFLRYSNQYTVIRDILSIFESSDDEKTSEEDSKKVSELMVKMQEYGNPPQEILKDLTPGLDLGIDGMPKTLPSDCQMM